MTISPRVIVIGGGLAGLVAANIAVDHGADVTLLESGGGFGGRALTQNRDGYYFNLGPHALYKSAAGAPILKELGILPDGNEASLDHASVVFEHTLHTFPFSLISLLQTSALNYLEKFEFIRVLSGLEKMDVSQYEGVSFSKVMDVLIKRPKVRQLFSAIARLSTYNHAPAMVCGASVLNQIKAANSGVLYLNKGWQALVDALVKRAKSKGVEVTLNAKVDMLRRDADGFALKDKSNRTWKADSVVLGISPKQITRLAGDSLGVTISSEYCEPIKLASLDLGLSRLPDPSRTFALGMDRPVYLSVHSATAELAPSDGALLHVSRYLDPEENISAKEIEAELESLIDLVQPGWRDFVDHRFFRPGLTVSHAMPLAINGGLKGRQAVSNADHPDLHFAGDWIGDAGLLADGAIASGALAGERAAKLSSKTSEALVKTLKATT